MDCGAAMNDFGMPGPDVATPEAIALQEERDELKRIAAVSALQHGRLTPEARAWAQHWAAIKPLGRPLSAGTPAHARIAEGA